jgi:hypothetical protein
MMSKHHVNDYLLPLILSIQDIRATYIVVPLFGLDTYSIKTLINKKSYVIIRIGAKTTYELIMEHTN